MTTSTGDVVFNATMNNQTNLQKRGEGIQEQCKMMTDLSYVMEYVDAGNKVLAQLCKVYKTFYVSCQDHSGIVHFKLSSESILFWEEALSF